MKTKSASLLIVKGFAIGMVDAIPGISGGTVALLSGIYPRLIAIASSVDLQLLRLLFKLEFRRIYKKLDLGFLLIVAVGIVGGYLAMANIVGLLVDNDYEVLILSFFLGLILAASLVLIERIKSWNMTAVLLLILGTAFGFTIVSLTPAVTPDEYWFIFIVGIVALITWILPGISGSFVLILFGKYETIIDAVRGFDFATLSVFFAGGLLGIILFSKLLNKLLKRYFNYTIATLTGIVLGAIPKIWPWKMDYGLPTEKNISPTFYEMTVGNSYLGYSILLMILGILLVIGLWIITKKINKRQVNR